MPLLPIFAGHPITAPPVDLKYSMLARTGEQLDIDGATGPVCCTNPAHVDDDPFEGVHDQLPNLFAGSMVPRLDLAR